MPTTSCPVGVKRKGFDPKWSVRLDDVSSLRAIVEAIQNVVPRVTFKINRQDDSSPYFLKADCADVAYVSCISVRYQLDSVDNKNGEEIRFCLDVKHVIPCLANLRQDHTVVIEGYEDQTIPKVHIRSFDPEGPSHESCYELSTFVDSDNVQLFPMKFEIILEIDLFMFRGLLKNATTAKAEQIAIRVYIKKSPGEAISFTHFSAKGEYDAASSFCHKVTEDEDGSMVVRAATDSEQKLFDIEEMEPEYEGLFPVDKIAGFVKPLQCRMLVAKVKQDKPIMFTHMIGGASDEKSQIRYLIAPLNSDAD